MQIKKTPIKQRILKLFLIQFFLYLIRQKTKLKVDKKKLIRSNGSAHSLWVAHNHTNIIFDKWFRKKC